MLTVRNMRPKPEPKVDKSLLLVAGMVVLGLLLWTASKVVNNSETIEQPKAIPVKQLTK